MTLKKTRRLKVLIALTLQPISRFLGVSMTLKKTRRLKADDLTSLGNRVYIRGFNDS